MELIIPMEPINTPQVIDNPDFVHEIKWDGIRGIVYINNAGVKVFTKKGNERTANYPEFQYLYQKLGAHKIVLDGEIIVPDHEGKPSFYNSLIRERVRNLKALPGYINNYPAKYMVFDILYYKDKLITNLKLNERKSILTETISPIMNDFLVLSRTFSNGQELFAKMKENNMEGIVSKNINSRYIGGKKHEAWFKTKFIKKILCIIGGIQWDGQRPNALVMGIKSEESPLLTYICKASLGLTQSDISLLKQYYTDLASEKCTFEPESLKNFEANGTRVTWINPLITCWVSFLELTNTGQLRHPKIIGFTSLPPESANGKILERNS